MTPNLGIEQAIATAAELDKLREEQRAGAIDYIKRIIKIFDLQSADLFSSDANTATPVRKGAVAICRAIRQANPTISRADFIAKATEQGVKLSTAKTQAHHTKLWLAKQGAK